VPAIARTQRDLQPSWFPTKAERLGTELHGEVPLDLKARETSDGRSPITVSEPDNPQVLVFRHIAVRIWEKVTGTHAEQRATRIVITHTPGLEEGKQETDDEW
jgi:hypothetical protein